MEISMRLSLLFLFFLVLGYIIGALVTVNADFKYRDASMMTCNYANNLTEIINLQSKTLKLCSGIEFTELTKINCSLLKIR